MKIEKVDVFGMELERWSHKSCIADFGTGDNFATLYSIHSAEEGKGHATALLTEAKKYYENKNLKFGGSVALSSRMRAIYQRLNIDEYEA